MAHGLAVLIAQYGLLVVFASVVAEQAGAPLPALPVLVVAGAAAAHGQLPLGGVVVVALVGCLLPDLAWYGIGRRFGGRVMRGLCRISLSPDSCIHQSELHFERWHGRSLLIAKFVPGLSIVAPPLVGALGLRLRAFLLLDGIGALVWVGVGVGLGLAFAGEIDRVLTALAGVSKLALAVTLGLLALYVGAKWWHRRRLRVALQVPRVTPAELNRALGSGHAPLVLDMRSPTSRRLEPLAIEGARLVAPDGLAAAVRDVPVDRDIVSYCSCPNEATSAKAAKDLAERGYRHVRPLLGGLRAWEAAGYRVRSLATKPAAPTGAAGAVHP